MKVDKTPKRPSLALAIFLFFLIVSVLIVGLLVFQADVHILLFASIIIAVLTGLVLGNTWEAMQKAMLKSLNRAMQALLFFFLIGMIVGGWIQSGTVPALIYYGLDLISPQWFLPAGLLLCSLVSLASGSSWTTAGTIGIALMGMGVGIGIPAPMVAGMIVSGAYFGDKMSPLSDTTNLAPAVSGTVLYKHIGAMMYTAIPTYIICLIAFTIMGSGFGADTVDTSSITLIRDSLSDLFNLNIITLLPIVVVLVLSIMRFPAIPGLAIGILTSIPISMGLQHMNILDAMLGLNYGFYSSTGVEAIDSLLTGGGIQDMMWTLSLTMIALCLGGVMAEIKILDVIIQSLLNKVKNIRAYPAFAILTPILVNFTMADQYMSIVLGGELFRDAFPKLGLQSRMLSRCLEEGGTVTSGIIPWTSCGAIMYGALGISAFEYMPYAIFNWLTPLFAILITLAGFTILTTHNPRPFKRLTNKDIEELRASLEQEQNSESLAS